jgi:multidrug efflux pump subunit AcrA (membrane-fusion protein)
MTAMLDRTTPNPREHIGANQPPGAIELAKPIVEELGRFLNDYPVITNEDEARKAKAISDRVYITLKSVEEERDSKVRPLNEQVAAINAQYHRWFCTNDKKPGLWGTLLKELKVRLTNFARVEEQKRREAAEAARRAAAEAERKAREAEAREQEAAADAAQGVCNVDIAAATERADQAFQDFQRADREAQRADRNATVRIGGGISGKVSTLRTVEVLTVTDWRAAIDDMIGPNGAPPAVIVEAILTASRAYRRENGELPPGIQVTHERRM